LYLVNYLHKLEFILEQSVKERQREKKARERKLDVIVEAVREKVGKNLTKGDDAILKYCKHLSHFYIFLRFGDNERPE
jgi:hypothetical protein